MLPRILLALESPALQRQLTTAVRDLDAVTEGLRGKRHLVERMARQSPDLIVVSHALLSKPVAESIKLLHDLPDAPAVVVLTDAEDAGQRAEFLAAGCEAVLNSQLPLPTLREVLQALLAKRREILDQAASGRPGERGPQLGDFVSASSAMQTFMNLARRVVKSDVSLLILGETGVGKEHLARAIHVGGARAAGPFVAINCGALPETLLDSELFGHEEGAFTGASRTRRGCFELAHSGTIFLDEIGELPLHLQVKMLRVLQERQIQRLGSEKVLSINVRIMAASNRDLQAEVEARRFRRDLYFRLGVITLTIPPLRDRREDIPLLAASYLDVLRPRVGRNVGAIHADVLQALVNYDWPGNVRELINVLERGMLLCAGQEIQMSDLPESVRMRLGTHVVSPQWPATRVHPEAIPTEWQQLPLPQFREAVLGSYEPAYLAALLRATNGRIGESASRAGIQARALYDRLKKYGLNKNDFKS